MVTQLSGVDVPGRRVFRGARGEHSGHELGEYAGCVGNILIGNELDPRLDTAAIGIPVPSHALVKLESRRQPADRSLVDDLARFVRAARAGLG